MTELNPVSESGAGSREAPPDPPTPPMPIESCTVGSSAGWLSDGDGVVSGSVWLGSGVDGGVDCVGGAGSFVADGCGAGCVG